MPMDPLERLLRETDADVGGAPHMPDDLAVRVLRRSQSQSRRRVAIRSAAAMIVLAAGASTVLWRRGALPTGVETPTAMSSANTARLVAETSALQTEADWRQVVAHRTTAIQFQQARIADLNRQAAQPDPVLAANREVERAAGTLFQQGDVLYRELDLPLRAAHSYREVLRLFPTSAWAALARERLTELTNTQGDAS
jgi:hypothetical protein